MALAIHGREAGLVSAHRRVDRARWRRGVGHEHWDFRRPRRGSSTQSSSPAVPQAPGRECRPDHFHRDRLAARDEEVVSPCRQRRQSAPHAFSRLVQVCSSCDFPGQTEWTSLSHSSNAPVLMSSKSALTVPPASRIVSRMAASWASSCELRNPFLRFSVVPISINVSSARV